MSILVLSRKKWNPCLMWLIFLVFKERVQIEIFLFWKRSKHSLQISRQQEESLHFQEIIESCWHWFYLWRFMENKPESAEDSKRSNFMGQDILTNWKLASSLNILNASFQNWCFIERICKPFKFTPAPSTSNWKGKDSLSEKSLNLKAGYLNFPRKIIFWSIFPKKKNFAINSGKTNNYSLFSKKKNSLTPQQRMRKALLLTLLLSLAGIYLSLGEVCDFAVGTRYSIQNVTDCFDKIPVCKVFFFNMNWPILWHYNFFLTKNTTTIG